MKNFARKTKKLFRASAHYTQETVKCIADTLRKHMITTCVWDWFRSFILLVFLHISTSAYVLRAQKFNCNTRDTIHASAVVGRTLTCENIFSLSRFFPFFVKRFAPLTPKHYSNSDVSIHCYPTISSINNGRPECSTITQYKLS